MTNTAKYEAVMIFNVNQGEEGVTALNDRFKKMIAENGTLDEVEDWASAGLRIPSRTKSRAITPLCA
jgi:ribosomal protein S6